MVEKPHAQTRVIPEGALLHFSVPQREYAAVRAAVRYFASKLQDPKARELAQRALQHIESPTGFSLPSEMSVKDAAPIEGEKKPPRRGFGGLRK